MLPDTPIRQHRIAKHMDEITRKPEPDQTAVDAGPPSVRARHSWHWRCPSDKCGHVQIAEKSTTHIARCKMCNRRAKVVMTGK